MVKRARINKGTSKLVEEAFYLISKLEECKELRVRLSEITEELAEKEFTTADLKGVDKVLMLVDNFAEKNTVFRSAGVSRFELKLIDKE